MGTLASYLQGQITELKKTIEELKANQKGTLNSYKFSARYYDHQLKNIYDGEIVIQAYSRDEAIAQFKETRLYCLKQQVQNNAPMPLGKETEFYCEAVEPNE